MATIRELDITVAGFDPNAEAELMQVKLINDPEAALQGNVENLRTLEEELLRDEPVTCYSTFFSTLNRELRIGDSPGEIVEGQLIEKGIRPEERSGLVLSWWRNLEQKLLKRKEKGEPAVFLWISPRGKAGEEGVFTNAEYPYHAVYIGIIGQNDKIRNWALKMNLDEEILQEWINSIPGEHNMTDTSIESFLNTPVVVGLENGIYSSQQFIGILESVLKARNLEVVYTAKKGENITTGEILRLMEQEKKPSLLVMQAAQIVDSRLRESSGYISQEDIAGALTQAYFHIIKSYAQDGKVEMSGCVGTISTDLFSLESVLTSPAERLLQDSIVPLSSSFRVVGSQNIETKPWSYHKGDCVNCSAKNTEVGPCNICRKCEAKFDK